MKRCEFRSRPLKRMVNKFVPHDFIKFTKQILKKKSKIRILEVGCGEGRVLMELRKLFPQKEIELYGLNKEKRKFMRNQKDFFKTAVYYNIMSKKEAEKSILPKIYFYNAEKLKFEDNFFDLIISQVSIQYIKRKDKFLEETWRVLAKDGKAYLQIDSLGKKYPVYMQHKTPRFLIYKENKIIDLKDLFKKFKKQGFNIKYEDRINSKILIIEKNNNKKLNLNLKFDKENSFYIGKSKRFDDDPVFWGYRSVFNY